MDEPSSEGLEGPIHLPVDGVLDLHTFRPKEIKDLVPEYLRSCREQNILEVRVVHGKGAGTLRQMVHSILKKMPAVETFSLARPEFGGWGATIVRLKKPDQSRD